ncbi:methionyl-tRNA formyltransferase [Microbacterium sp. SYP-A9085]|uniref:methionyl-tRNA formyltransferase n=1 Tax=Microbacterium sp. SYP-A9085 TaxID=2664454 RepID=UPI00129BC876|nr:methionyl-tRNA formyltransferase [Microbacterium sp. SYP-A9085]MRH29489.1 methionyl-tRNA formyltransferase [Microbacterium sp. SYP-A9085]
MRLVFAGTPAAAVPSLRRLAASRHEIVAVLTRPDAPQGRRRVLTPSPVAAAAEDLGLPILKTATLGDAATAVVQQHAPDLGVVVAYGGLVREPLLSAPAHGWVNLHFSLLPRWRGAAPVQRALIAGDQTTGATVFRLVRELDAGDVLGEVRYDVPGQATAADVLDALAHRGGYLLADVVDAIADGTAVPRPQTGAPTSAPKLTLEDGRLRWEEPLERVLARWQGTTPEPGAFTTVDGARLKILVLRAGDRDVPLAPGRIAEDGGDILIGTGTEPVVVERVQPAGRSAMSAADWWRGLRADEPVAGS